MGSAKRDVQLISVQTNVIARGFHVWTDNIWDSDSWSDPIYHSVNGIDQDVSHSHIVIELVGLSSYV